MGGNGDDLGAILAKDGKAAAVTRGKKRRKSRKKGLTFARRRGIILLVDGALAQLVARLNGIQKVRGSTPLCSTRQNKSEPSRFGFLYFPRHFVQQLLIQGAGDGFTLLRPKPDGTGIFWHSFVKLQGIDFMKTETQDSRFMALRLCFDSERVPRDDIRFAIRRPEPWRRMH